MIARRTAVLAVVAGAAGAALTSCSKPTPGVSLAADGTTVHATATTYCRAGTCHDYSTTPPVLRVNPGDHVGISVDDSVRSAGWLITVNGQQFSNVEHKDYVSITVPAFSQQTPNATQLRVVKVTDAGNGRLRPTGQWVFVLAGRG